MLRDIFSNSTIGRVLSQEDKDWFFSSEYTNALDALSKREIDTFFFVFLKMKDEIVGFTYYGTYLSEDGKCFISEFCILPEFRNKGLGKEYFNIIKEAEIERGAKFFELNVSNERNKSFWEKLGFEFDGFDEHNVMLMKLIV
jgi:ribosomal protein S18 acetylase RimI-like enzyme